MESKDNNIMDKVPTSIDERYRSVDVVPSFRRLVRKKIEKPGNLTILSERTGIHRPTIKSVAEGRRVHRKSLQTLVFWLIGSDANVEDYIEQPI